VETWRVSAVFPQGDGFLSVVIPIGQNLKRNAVFKKQEALVTNHEHREDDPNQAEHHMTFGSENTARHFNVLLFFHIVTGTNRKQFPMWEKVFFHLPLVQMILFLSPPPSQTR